MARSTDPEQISGELLQLGTVASVDHGAGTCTVDLGDLVTGDLPWFAGHAGAIRIWSPPSIGEQCVVLALEGDLANGLVLLGLYSDASPAPSTDPDVVHAEMPDGATFAYNHATSALTVTLPTAGTMTVDAPGGTKWNGDIDLVGKLTASDDVVAAGISVKDHKHSDVQAGGAQTGRPV